MLNAVLVIITIMVIMGLAMLFHTCIKVTPEESVASSIMTIMLFIYITGMMGNTKIALYIIYTLAACGVILSIAGVIRKKEYSVITFFSPAVIMAIMVACIGIIAFRGFMISNWDELYQWGKAADFMMEYDTLPQGENFAGQAELLSSTTLFHYFIARLSSLIMGVRTESNYYVSNLFLWFSAVILPLSGCKWKEWRRVAAYGLFHFMLTALIFVQPYYNIYTDQATSYWAGGLIAWMLLRKYNKRNMYIIPIILLNVGLMKSMVGPLFAVIVILSACTLYILSRKEQNMSILPSDLKKRVLSTKGILIVLGIISPFLLVGVWSVLSGKNGFWRFHSLEAAAGEEDRVVLTLKSMIGWIFKSVNLKDDHLFLSYGSFIIITVGLVYIIYPLIMSKKDLLYFQGLMKVYIVGFALFFMIMFATYISVFGYTDSVRAMSLNRYYSDYMMLGVVPLTLPLFQSEDSEGKWTQGLKKGLILLSLLCIIYGSSDYFLSRLSHVYAIDTTKYARREELAGYCEKVKKLTGEKGKIYFVNQKRSGLYTLVADYDMGEQVSRGGMCYKFRKNTDNVILGLTDYPIETLPQVLINEGYEYLWIYSTNTYFNDSMKEIFGKKKMKNGYFYKVIPEEDGVRLEYLDTIK